MREVFKRDQRPNCDEDCETKSSKYCLPAIWCLKIVCNQSEIRNKGMNCIAMLSKLYCGLANGVIWNIWENQVVKDICSWFLPAWCELELRMDRDEWEKWSNKPLFYVLGVPYEALTRESKLSRLQALPLSRWQNHRQFAIWGQITYSAIILINNAS